MFAQMIYQGPQFSLRDVYGLVDAFTCTTWVGWLALLVAGFSGKWLTRLGYLGLVVLVAVVICDLPRLVNVRDLRSADIPARIFHYCPLGLLSAVSVVVGHRLRGREHRAREALRRSLADSMEQEDAGANAESVAEFGGEGEFLGGGHGSNGAGPADTNRHERR